MITASPKSYYLISVMLSSVFLITGILLESDGRRARIEGPFYPVADRRVPVVLVYYPVEAYRFWRLEGFRGRVVVSMSSRLNFIPPDSSIYPEFYPLDDFDPVASVEKNLRDDNFLFASMEADVARAVIHVVPEKVFLEKAALLKEGGRPSENGSIFLNHYGAPREILTLPGLKAVNEPVLLFVNASFFSEHRPDDVLRLLNEKALKTDYIVLCASFDDPDVTPDERMKLRAFAGMINGK